MSNGHHNGYRESSNRPAVGTTPERETVVHRPDCMRGHSGRRLVLLACFSGLALWGAVYLLFVDWRARYRVRASFGATQVAPIVDAFREIEPNGVDPAAWREAVQETHAMLVSVTAANLLDLQQMAELRDELRQITHRARTHPETARPELAGIWDRMAERAPFVLQEGTSGRKKGHPRPPLLQFRQNEAKSAGDAPATPAAGGSASTS